MAADLCYFSGRILLVVTDYFSSFIEVDSLSAETSKVVIRGLMAMFSRYGVPDTLVTDDRPCFASSEFKKFASTWDFEHVTSISVTRKAMARLKMLFALLNASLPSAVPLVSVNSKDSWIGATLQVRVWTQVQHSD